MKNLLKYNKLSFLACLCFLSFLASFSNISAASKLKLSYSGKKTVYSGRQVKSATVDGKKINLNKTNGIFMKGNAMVSYVDVFKKGLGVKCSYSSSKKTIKFKQNNITIIMTVGSKTAYVNGKKQKMSVAPTRVRYISKKKTKILVPAKFLSQNLGYAFSWNTSKGRISLTRPTLIKYNGKWNVYKKQIGRVSMNGMLLDSLIPSLSMDGVIMVPAKQVFGNLVGMDYIYNSANKQLTLKSNNNEIQMTLGSKKAVVNGKAHTLKTAPLSVKIKSSGKSYIMVPASFTSSKLGFYYTWNKVLNTAEIQIKTYFIWNQKNKEFDLTKYANQLVNCSAKYDKSSNSILITVSGSNADNMMKVTEIKDDVNNQVYFDFPSTFNDIGDSSFENLSSILKKVELSQIEGESARLALTMTNLNNYEYSINNTTVTIQVYPSKIEQGSIQLLKPEGVPFEAIKNEDLYEKRKFTITIPGDHIQFYNNNPIQANNNVIQSVNVSLDSTKKNTVITVSTSKLQGYRISEQGKYIRVVLGNPREIYPNIVILDAGHGGKDSGATNNKVLEKDLNLTILYNYAKKYFDAPDSQVKAYWTRKDDTFVELYDRAGYANVMGADLFVSLHMNSFTSSTPNGTEVYYSASNNSTLASGLNSKAMATIYKNNIVKGLGMTDRGVQAQKYVVVHRNTVPAVLIELGFISNSSNLKKLTDSAIQDKAAKIIYDSTVEIFKKYPTGR